MTHPRISKFLLGTVLALATLIGGGTTRGLYTDQLLVSLCVVACAMSFSRPSAEPIGKVATFFPLGIMLICLLQLLPLPKNMLSALRPDFLDPAGQTFAFTTISSGMGQTVESLLLVIAPVAFFFSVVRLPADDAKGLMPFFLLGVVVNMVVAAIQYSMSSGGQIEGVLPYPLSAGLFANVNHFSTLLFIAIPLVVYLVFKGTRPILSLLSLACILLLLLAASSRAGALIGLAITVCSFIILPSRNRWTTSAVIAVLAGTAVYTAGAWSKIDADTLEPGFGRLEFAHTTIEGIADNWVFGIGYGNFVKGYPIYEDPQMIFAEYVNHAHNDYLELIFEGGIVAAIMLCLYFVILAGRGFSQATSGLQRAAMISIMFILVHSIVDYPLRTMAIAIPFAFLNGLVFHAGLRRPERAPSALMEVNHNGATLMVPIAGGR